MAGRDVTRTGERAPGARRRPDAPARQPAGGPLADLQAAIGNRALQRRLAGSPTGPQAKLEVNAPGDAHEREADRVADAVMAMPDPAVQRQSDAELEEPDEEIAPRLARQPDVEELEEPEEVAPRLARQPDAELEEPDEEIAPRLARQPDAELEEPEEEIAPKAAAAPVLSDATESVISRSRGGGHPLDSDTRGFFEPRFGRDLGGVKVHTDPGAARLAAGLGAQAFTVGRDIYFARGRYEPGTTPGRSLLAHELTHTVQQKPGARLDDRPGSPGGAPAPASVHRRVQRQAEGTATAAPPADAGRITEGSEPRITYPELKVPPFKAETHRGQVYERRRSDLKRSRNYRRGNPDQTAVWDASFTDATIEDHLKARLGSTVAPGEPGKTYILKHAGSGYRLIGTLANLVPPAKRPVWDREGTPRSKDVDHIVELQVAGWDGSGPAWANSAKKLDEGGNMELLDSQANSDSGRRILVEMERLIGQTRQHYWKRPADAATADPDVNAGFWIRDSAPSVKAIKQRYDLTFDAVTGGLGQAGSPDNHWKWEEVAEGSHLAEFEADTSPGTGSTWAVFPFSSGGIPKLVEHTGGEWADADAATEQGWLNPFKVRRLQLADPGPRDADATTDIGELEVGMDDETAASGKPYRFFANRTVLVKSFPGVPNAGYLDRSGLLGLWRSVQVRGLSPLDIASFDVVPGEGFQARGTLLPDVPIMADLGIDLVVDGDTLYLSKLFDIGDFDLPGPVEITHSTVELTAGTNGIGANGELGLAIEGVGQGLVTARIGSETGFALTGSFEFDPELFDPPSRIEMGYEDGEFSGSGTLSIGEDRVRGIRSASITATYARGQLEATGEAELDVPGLQRGTMSLTYSEEDGFAIGGTFELSPDVPGISSGSVTAEVRQQPEGGYAVSAGGFAVPDIPGVAATVAVSYDDGIFTAEGTAAYQRGFLSGALAVGATNQLVDEDGHPTGEAGDTLRAFGGGELTLRLAPWLAATAGVRLTPEGEVEVTGRIGLPAALEVFPARRFDRNLVTVNLDIPIVGVSVLGQRIGIFATIGGGLDLTAGFGPGELRQLEIEVFYNPDHEEDTRVSGGAEFVVPADAGLRLFVRGALGAGIPVVSASAGLEVGGQLGIAGAVRAGVEVAWTPTDGIELDAEAEIFAEPKFAFDITGFVMVEASLLVRTVELYSKRWRLAGFEYGSGLRLGATFPIHYVEGEPFDVSLDDIAFQVPDVDPRALLTGLVRELA